ncbi:MAG: Flp pilus assembly complex ATPase component TadA [Oligoflexia bacterium]|nr:Flp pilus assembly complex ATPase component TadA [Oligoflexia bacterium]
MAINPQCHVIAISGGKGGVGKSVFAANFAQALMLELRARVLLIDLDAQSCGDQNVLLGLRPNKTISEVATFGGHITAQTISTLIAPHNSGLHFIGAVRAPGDIYDVNVEGLKKSIESLSHLYNFIVVDIGTHFQNPQLAMIEMSSVVLLLTLPEILSTNQTMKTISQLMTQMFPADMLQVVLNKVSQSNPLTPQMAAQSLKKNPVGVIPQDDVIVSQALSRSTPFVASQPRAPISIAFHETVRRLTSGGTLDKLRSLNKPKGVQSDVKNETQIKPLGAASTSQTRPNDTKKAEVFDSRTVLKRRLHRGLIETMDLKKGITETNGDPAKETELRVKTQQSIAALLDKEGSTLSREERALIVKEVLDEALGLGPLEDLLSDQAVSEIMVNRRDLIYVERSGKLTRTDFSFTSNQQLLTVIERIVTPLGRRIDEKTPYVDARLKDGSRVNAVIPPLAIDGPCITIRKFAKTPITYKDYANFGTMTEPMIDFLRICVENGLNIIISGGTGSGKTTLLNVLSGFIPATERIITVEDAAELQLKQDHVIRLETRPPNMEGEGAVTIRDLIRNTLRMRPDRIVVGECRGAEALDMLAAMSTGHDGSLSTVHANSPREAIKRLVNLCSMAKEAPSEKAIMEQITSAVDLIIQISRLSDGSRKILSITEVVGMQGDIATTQEVYRFKEEGFDKNRKIIGQFQATGFIPTFIEEFERKGVKVPRTLFAPPAASGPAKETAATGTGGKK